MMKKLAVSLMVTVSLLLTLVPFSTGVAAEKKVGVLLIGWGEPEKHDANAYIGWKNFMDDYTEGIFNMLGLGFMYPQFGERIEEMMGDAGTLLVDRDDPLASKEKENPHLIDAWGRAYTGKDYVWVPLTEEESLFGAFGGLAGLSGYYLSPKGPGRGEPDSSELTGLLMYSLYQSMGNHNPGEERELRIMDEVEKKLREKYGDKVVIARGFTPCFRPGFPDSREQAEKLVKKERVTHLVLPVLMDAGKMEFENPPQEIKSYLKQRRIKVNIVLTEQILGTKPFSQGVAKKVSEELKRIPQDSDVVVFLTHHGMPYCDLALFPGIGCDLRECPYHRSAKVTFSGAKKAIYHLNAVKDWEGMFDVWQTYNEMAEGLMDPENEILSVKEAARKAIDEGYEYCIDIPYEVGNSGYETLIGLREESWELEPGTWEEYSEDGLRKYRTEFEYDGMRVVITDGWIDGTAESYYQQLSKAIDSIL
jgi:hypothetical protein